MNKRPHETVSQPLLASLILLLSAAAVPHFLHLSGWVALFFMTMIALRVLATFKPHLVPNRIILAALAVIAVVNVLFRYPMLFSGEATVALMTSMVSLKLLEIRSRRDLYVVVFVGYFLLVTQFLFEQGMLMVAYVFLLALGLTAVLVEANRTRPSTHPLRPLRTALSLLLQAAPLMVVLFIFFPRLSGPIWSLSQEETRAATGMGDSISPGSISELVRSRAVAFRADFEGPLPEPPQRYWRGLVLWQTDGKNWTQDETKQTTAATYRGLGPALEYSITLEPTQNRWLYALDLPAKGPQNAILSPDFLLLRKEPVSRRILYRASSYLQYDTGALTPEERSRALQLPANITSRMTELVKSWKRESPDALSLVNRALRYFREQEFYYTLYPPLLKENPVDQFLFDSRRGFCEHYASSFATLMRLAGVPARVVIGYQGGERNPMGDYLIIRQSDAHAWTEVWLEGRGWTRIDPTAAVAPERIERSFDFDLDEVATPIGTPVQFNVESDFLKSLARQLRWGMDVVNASWHRWVLGYTRERQSHLMDLLGLGFLKGHKLGIGMVVASALVVLLLGFHIWRKGRVRLDPVQADYLRFCARLRKRGLPRHSFEGPADYGRRVARRWPQQSETTGRIIRLYIQLRYGKGVNKENRNRFHRLVRKFKP